MQLFICEFISSGGFAGKPLPEGLAREGQMMRDTLIADLSRHSNYSLQGCHDVRVPAGTAHDIPVSSHTERWEIWQQLAQKADIFWPIAPESDQQLRKIVQFGKDCDCQLISSDLETIAIASSKLYTARHLHMADIPCVNTFTPDHIPKSATGWVLKPDDGVGSENCYHYTDKQQLLAAITALPEQKQYILQPYILGLPMSLSMLCLDGEAELLACNTLNIAHHKDRLSVQNIVINGMCQYWDEMAALSKRLAEAMRGLRGYIGVDLILSADGPLLIDINPRLTSSYVGLRASLGVNITLNILEMFVTNCLPSIQATKRQAITVTL